MKPGRTYDGSRHRGLHPCFHRFFTVQQSIVKLKTPVIRTAIKKVLLVYVLGLVFLQLAFIALTSVTLFAYKWVNPPATILMLHRAVVMRWPVQRSRFLPLEKIPQRARTMIIRVEDSTFFTHRGILPSALKHAWMTNKQIGRPVYGGSTITMQTARTLFLVPEKSYFRKYLEMIIALEMELILGKDRIFELYLNYAEWGRGVFGIEAAARHHFDRPITELGRDQTIRLVTLLSSPIRYTPQTLRKNSILNSRYVFLSERF